ncbi:Holliday junction branch migration protein RuvA [Marichromatium gracile]|uniref:Holliday junction branch migration complex subunit RuvA n=1 Tax=Marichromatium gracile TaxID=1048 RepID=A0A4R4AG72_MARGR|nr:MULTISPECIES: Holliday junction branch migration protein RuvA [Marichromatium]MBO8084446.1 Holliday junction branch migration protein RuvA [Marichromatium sp.]MBK1709254.1 Holliday junction branch migration protein RuvA [Marichromatium gracile]MCF1182869.1 Holliday junction branch migration protein RuvA [Marichromatium gracile]RNE94413.1 Holliday junction branch migration protein RuvA [Marichromatium sp. AB32]TCW38238.1 Holliday junction DNA helicase subunit RuvA [Marichromatium gracile]
MIGRLRGQLVHKQPPRLMLDVGGVGYELEAPMSTFYELPAVGETVTLITHLAVREDAQVLYGFIRESDRALFRNLLKVTGVGARMALAILSGMDAARFAQCVEYEDVAALTKLPGIGKKTAQRLVVEMRDRLEATLTPALAGAAGESAPGTDQALADAVSALVALGFRPADATRMARAADDGAKTSEEIIRLALRSVNPA